MIARPLRVVAAPAPAEPACPGPRSGDIAAQWRAEAKGRDWTRVHVEGDRNEPIHLTRRPWRWSLPSPWGRS